MDFPKSDEYWRLPVRVAAAYMVLSGIWIVVSDWLVHTVAPSPEVHSFMQTYKGLLFVSVTSLLLFLLLRHHSKRRAERDALIRRQARLLDIADVAIIVRDWNGPITYWNRQAEDLYGWTAGEAVGRFPRELFSEGTGDEGLPDVKAALLKHGSWRGEVRQTTKQMREVIVESQLTLVGDSNNQPESVLCINADKTEHKFLEEQVRQSQKLQSIGSLAAGISHDFSNVLAAVNGYSELLMNSLGPEESDRRHMVEGILAAGGRGRNLVRRISTFLQHREAARTDVKLDDQVEEITTMLRDTFPSGIVIETEFEGDLPALRGDPLQLQQVVLNLCVNARDAMLPSGTVVVRVRRAASHEMLAGESTEHLCLEISDTGQGIPEEIQSTLFDPFVTTKHEVRGTGLGLWVVEGIVRAHRGWIDLKTLKGRGTTFFIYFPVAKAEETPEPKKTSPAPERDSPKTLLVVEDGRGGEGFVSRCLRQHGYEVAAANGEEEAFSLYQSDTRRYGTVIVDFDLKELDGSTFLERHKALAPDTPVLVVAGSRDERQEEELLRHGAADIVGKPYGAMELLKAVQETLLVSRRRFGD